jgi:hypothetical protein
MSFHVDAIYDQGVFRPAVPPEIPDKTPVKLTVEPQSAGQQ